MNYYEIRRAGRAIAWVLAPSAARALHILRLGRDSEAIEIPEDAVDPELRAITAARNWREGLLAVAEGATR